MRKVLIALMLLIGSQVLVSCTNDDLDDIEILSPDNDTCPPGGCPQ